MYLLAGVTRNTPLLVVPLPPRYPHLCSHASHASASLPLLPLILFPPQCPPDKRPRSMAISDGIRPVPIPARQVPPTPVYRLDQPKIQVLHIARISSKPLVRDIQLLLPKTTACGDPDGADSCADRSLLRRSLLFSGSSPTKQLDSPHPHPHAAGHLGCRYTLRPYSTPAAGFRYWSAHQVHSVLEPAVRADAAPRVPDVAVATCPRPTVSPVAARYLDAGSPLARYRLETSLHRLVPQVRVPDTWVWRRSKKSCSPP